MLQIWLLYDSYFFVCAYIVAKPYGPKFADPSMAAVSPYFKRFIDTEHDIFKVKSNDQKRQSRNNTDSRS